MHFTAFSAEVFAATMCQRLLLLAAGNCDEDLAPIYSSSSSSRSLLAQTVCVCVCVSLLVIILLPTVRSETRCGARTLMCGWGGFSSAACGGASLRRRAKLPHPPSRVGGKKKSW